jgi:hypothetical protein
MLVTHRYAGCNGGRPHLSVTGETGGKSATHWECTFDRFLNPVSQSRVSRTSGVMRDKGVRLAATMMTKLVLLISCALLLLAAGCVRPSKYMDIACGKMPGETLVDREAAIQCQQFRQDEAATAVYNEATLLLTSYRACLEKYEQAPARAREYCGQYGKALRDIGLQIKEPLETELSTKDTARTPPKIR